jgi:hypothetical protein
MYLIQPCCAKKDLRELRDSIARGGTKQFEGYGDLSLTELLPALLLRYDGVEMMIIAPSLPDQAAEIIDVWMRRQWASKDGKGKLDVIGHLTIMARLEKESSATIMNWIEQRPFDDRLTLIDQEQEETAILLPDFAITGPVNMRYNKHFTAEATTDMEKVKALWERFRPTPTLPEQGGSPKAGEDAGTTGDAAATVRGPKKRKTRKSKKQ